MSGLIGGALKKSMKSNNMDMSGLSMFFIVAIILVVKTFLVKVCYNEVVPKIMKDKGVNVARRTVAKYREMMNIPSSAERRRLMRLNKVVKISIQ